PTFCETSLFLHPTLLDAPSYGQRFLRQTPRPLRLDRKKCLKGTDRPGRSDPANQGFDRRFPLPITWLKAEDEYPRCLVIHGDTPMHFTLKSQHRWKYQQISPTFLLPIQLVLIGHRPNSLLFPTRMAEIHNAFMGRPKPDVSARPSLRNR